MLPPELLQRIGQHLFVNSGWSGAHDDAALYTEVEAEAKDSLLSCSRVCRAFRLAALPYLFHTICFYINADITEVTRDQDDPNCQCRSLRGLRLLAERHPPVRDNIQEVRVRSGCIEHWYNVVLDTEELVTTLHSLPRLRVVWLHDLRFELSTLPRSIPLTATATLPSLDALHISRAGQLDATVFGTVLASFSSITKLSIGDSCCTTPEDIAITDLAGHRAHIDTPEAAPFADNFHILLSYLCTNTIERGSLKSLQLRGSTEMFDLPALGSFLEFTGSSIVDTYLRLYPFQDSDGCAWVFLRMPFCQVSCMSPR